MKRMRDSSGNTRERKACKLEQGGRDWRLLPVAVALWAAQLATRSVFDALMAGDYARTGAEQTQGVRKAALLALLLVASLACVALLFAFRRAIFPRFLNAAQVTCVASTCMVAIGVMLIGSLVCWSHLMMTWHDPAAVRAREGSSQVTVMATVVEPVKTASIREADCQVEVRAASLEARALIVRSSAQLRVFASSNDCNQLRRGATYRFNGTLREAEFGTTTLWLQVAGIQGVTMLCEPSWFERARTHIHERFFDAASKLSDQGKVLVPGLTLGLLGQDYVSSGSQWDVDAIDPVFAAHMEEVFARAGIIHLMAVSGGHFVLVAALVRRLCARVLLHRMPTAGLIALSYTVLAALMAPGDSVLRAQVMGYFGALALAVGRKYQVVSALCCTTIGTLLVAPSMACSFGFALSSAAVLGISVLAEPIAQGYALLLPDALAKALALTSAAQLATMPIQVLMQPQLPVWSLAANVLVAPVVDFSTLTGLAALACAWCNVDLAFCLEWLSSCGTRVMEVVARWLGAGNIAVLPWAHGLTGAISLLGVEILALWCAASIRRVMRRRRLGDSLMAGSTCQAHRALNGTPFTASPRNRLSIWLCDTRRFLHRYSP